MQDKNYINQIEAHNYIVIFTGDEFVEQLLNVVRNYLINSLNNS